LKTLGVVGCYVGFYALIRCSVQNKKELSRLLLLWSGVSFFVALANIAYFSFVASHAAVVPIVEDFPFWPGKNMLGLFLALNASIALGVLLAAKNELKTWGKVWVCFVLAANLACLVITFSRGAWVAMVGVVAVLIFVRPKICLPLVGLGLALFFLLAPYGLKGRLFSIFDLKEANVQERLLIWQSALNMIHDDPWTGVGLGTFYQQYLSKYKMDKVQLEWAGEHAHNLFLHVFAEMGVLGLLVLIFFFASFLTKGIRNYSQQTDPFLKGAILGGILASVAFLVYSLVDSTFNGNFSHHSMFHVNLCFMIVLSLMVFSCSKSQSS
jgi:putative inorganic carbon (HCO3(-)) transporter